IVNFTSPAIVQAAGSLGAYSAAKGAVGTLTRSVALEEKKHKVRANAIAPGMIDTEQNRQAGDTAAQFVTREQIIDATLFLLDDASSGITGQTIHVLGETYRG